MGKSIIEDMVKELIVEMAKDGTAEEAAKDTGIPPNKQEVGKITYSKDGDTKFTVTDIDDETGKISWKVEKLPSYEELFNDSTELVDTAKGVRNEAKGDSVFRDIYERAKTLRNIIRTHLRNEYPDEYRRIVMRLSENDLTEQLSVSDMVNLNDKRVEAVAKAIMDKYDIPDDGRLKGIIRVALSDYLEEMSTTGGGSASFTPGTGMAYATPYAFNKNKKAKGTDDDIYTKEFGYKLVKENIDKGDGVDLDAYGYKLVPKNKDGSYVQKGSKLDVKQLFEDQKGFQAKRVAAFDVIEQELNDIYKMLSNAKNETSDYYNDNPSSYNVIKPTDLVLDYIKDIKDLLKGE